MFRDVLHKNDTQFGIENLKDIPFKCRLSEAIFAGNCLSSVNSTTPYNAVYGRVPHLLPNITAYAQPERDGETQPLPGLIHHSGRLRDIEVQNMA